MRGTLKEVRRHERLDGHVEVVLEVEAVEPVEGAPNLLGHVRGSDAAVTAPASDVGDLGLEPGSPIAIDAELRGPGAIWARPKGIRRA